MNSKTKGFSLVELIIATAIFVIYVGGLAVAASGSHLTRLGNEQRLQAQTVLTEGWEQLKIARNLNWASVTSSTTSVNGYTRMITVSDVYRDASGNIVGSGGQLDPDTKAVNILVEWSPQAPSILTMEASTLITNYQSAIDWPPES